MSPTTFTLNTPVPNIIKISGLVLDMKHTDGWTGRQI